MLGGVKKEGSASSVPHSKKEHYHNVNGCFLSEIPTFYNIPCQK